MNQSKTIILLTITNLVSIPIIAILGLYLESTLPSPLVSFLGPVHTN